jgi:hypothetical protein
VMLVFTTACNTAKIVFLSIPWCRSFSNNFGSFYAARSLICCIIHRKRYIRRNGLPFWFLFPLNSHAFAAEHCMIFTHAFIGCGQQFICILAKIAFFHALLPFRNFIDYGYV